jgi:hypothetical protein
MASQKVRPPALQRLFKTSTYNMYVFTLEQPLRLGVRNFCLAILFVFARPSLIVRNYCSKVVMSPVWRHCLRLTLSINFALTTALARMLRLCLGS